MMVKHYVLAITQRAYALAAPSGEITSGTLTAALGRAHFPPDPAGVRTLLAAAHKDAAPVDLVLVLEASDSEPELTAAAVAEQLFGVARVHGMAVVDRAAVIGVLASVKPNVGVDAPSENFVAAVNTPTGGEFTDEQAGEAWAVAVLVAGMSKKFLSTKMLELLRRGPPALATRRARDTTSTEARDAAVSVAAPDKVDADLVPPETAPVVRAALGLDDMGPSTMLTVDDITRLFGVSRSFAYGLKGRIRCFRFGGFGARGKEPCPALRDEPPGHGTARPVNGGFLLPPNA